MKPVPHGEPYAGNLHVRFDEGYPPKNGEVRFEGSRRPSGRTRQQGALRSTLLAGVYDILFGMRRCRISLPNRCYHLISRVAHRALEFGGLQAANRKGRYDKENLLWQSTVAIRSDPVGSDAKPRQRRILQAQDGWPPQGNRRRANARTRTRHARAVCGRPG